VTANTARDEGAAAAYPTWATFRWRLLYRLFHAVPAQEAEQYVVERNEWQQRVSDACGTTWEELHGGGATIYGTLDECVQQIVRLRERISG
jgi:hypothetical protein